MVSTSKRTLRLAIAAPLLSFSVTEAVPVSPAHNVAAAMAGLLTGAHTEPVAGVMVINAAAMVAGVTVAVTAEVAPALSVTVKVTAVVVAALAGVTVNDAPLIAALTGSNVGLLDTTVNGPLPPVMPIVLGVLPNATNVAGPASSVLETVGVDELLPPQPESASAMTEAIAPSASFLKRV